jgi:CRP/FNR family cyclic AMP-dependent transcriptional regulator
MSATAPATGLTPDEAIRLAERMVRRELRAGARLSEGDTPDALIHLVLSGSVRLFYQSGGREITVGSVRPGGLIGLGPLFGRPPDGRLAEATEPSVVASCTGDRFVDLLRGEPRLVRALVALLCDRIVQTEHHLTQLTHADAPARLMRVLDELAEAPLSPSGTRRVKSVVRHEDLAHLIGASRETVTRTLKRLETEGRIRRIAGRIVLQPGDPA